MNEMVSLIFLIVGIVLIVCSHFISEFVSDALENASREAKKYLGEQSIPEDNVISSDFIKFLGGCLSLAGIFFLTVRLFFGK